MARGSLWPWQVAIYCTALMWNPVALDLKRIINFSLSEICGPCPCMEVTGVLKRSRAFQN